MDTQGQAGLAERTQREDAVVRQVVCTVEKYAGGSTDNMLIQGSILEKKEELLSKFEEKVQMVYIDPPFYTGRLFVHKQRCGEQGWRTGSPSLHLPAYSDQWTNAADFLEMMREALLLAYRLLREDGSLFLHIDHRMHAQLRLMLDDIFGSRNFANEIIWAYQSGGRSTKHFSRKHDIILFYRKSKRAYFDIQAVGVKRAQARRNHMRRGVDEEGREYRAIVSQGKEYRYYEEDLAYPGDVWDDISHLHQKDPERSGYDSQKPIKLLERIVLCSTRPGDLVCDLFAGSGTTGVAAAMHDRRFLLIDASPIAVSVARKRLIPYSMCVYSPCAQGAPKISAKFTPALGIATAELCSYALEAEISPLELAGIEAVDQIFAGYLREGAFYVCESAARDALHPKLEGALQMPLLSGEPAILTVDVLGRKFVHLLEE